ncbi:MAG: hypothetical protein ACRD03_15445, partial [Acidimicrobiales bacterium]
MTIPEDAGAPPRDGDPAPGTAEATPGAAPGAGPGAALPDKPILEWTEEDWAGWIARPPALLADDSPPPGDEGPGSAGEAGGNGGHPDAVATPVD